MKSPFIYLVVLICASNLLTSCKTLESASVHGLKSGYYSLKSENKYQDVYLDVSNDQIDIYRHINNKIDKNKIQTISFTSSDNKLNKEMAFIIQSLDIDITSILLKYRPSISGLPAQLTTDINVALYAGWRHDSYKISNKKDPLGKYQYKVGGFGYDFGFFVGPGTTTVNAFSTNNIITNEYSGMIIQTGFAGFLESNVASFGISLGFDHLLNPDRKIWVYQNKPWIGFVVGIALN